MEKIRQSTKEERCQPLHQVRCFHDLLIVFHLPGKTNLEPFWKVGPKKASLKRRLGKGLTEILKCPISEVGRKSFGSLISPSKYRVIVSDLTSCVVDGHHRAVTTSLTFSFQATSSLEMQVLLKNLTRRLRATDMALGTAMRFIACDSRPSRVRNKGIAVPLAKQS